MIIKIIIGSLNQELSYKGKAQKNPGLQEREGKQLLKSVDTSSLRKSRQNSLKKMTRPFFGCKSWQIILRNSLKVKKQTQPAIGCLRAYGCNHVAVVLKPQRFFPPNQELSECLLPGIFCLSSSEYFLVWNYPADKPSLFQDVR